MALSALNRRRWLNFRKNRRSFWSFVVFTVLFVLSLFAELIANDKPLLVSYRGALHLPLAKFYSERDFGGDLPTAARYQDIELQCLIKTGGLESCFDAPEDELSRLAAEGPSAEDLALGYEKGWMIWPLIPYHYSTIVDIRGVAPSAPDPQNWLGTDDTKRDVLARVIYGFRLSIVYALIVSIATSVVGIIVGALSGYLGGWFDMISQRVIEIWSATPMLYVIIIVFSILGRSFWLLVGLAILFGWMGLVGVVRAEFLRARNFEYVRAARALGVSDWNIMFRHMLPNAMVATITMLPFIVTGQIGALAALDFMGFGLPSSAPSLGELAQQAKDNLQAPWLGFTAFFTFAIMLTLLVFIFEGVRDAFDPRKTFK